MFCETINILCVINHVHVFFVCALCVIEPPSGYFEVFFLGVKQSRYRKSHVFQSGLTQEAILTSEWTEDVD